MANRSAKDTKAQGSSPSGATASYGNRSVIEMELPPEVKIEFDRLLATGRLTLDALVVWLEGRGYEISRSSVHRYKSRYDRVAARLRQSRAATQALAAELGDAAVQGQQGRLLVEMARNLADDFMATLPEDRQLDPKDIALLGKGLAELARAARLDQDFETKVDQARKAAAAAATAAAAEAASDAARSQGLDETKVAFLRARILGVQVDG